MTLNDHFKILSEMEENDRDTYLTHLELKNYGSSELTETEMWILSQAASNNEYLTNKLKEADELTLDKEAPVEKPTIDSGVDSTTDSSDTTNDDLTLDTPSDTDNTDTGSSDTGSSDTDNTDTDNTDTDNTDTGSSDTDKSKKKIETSKEGIGILPLLGEIQEKLATGKPSEVELAALKAIKKLVD